tara:strand:+ start:24 stop:521 length:498 start_codon:yes stop_codon:yes gene_type:complete
MVKIFHPRGLKELIWKAGRTTETVAFKRLIKKHPKQGIRAFTIAQRKGLKKVQALGKRHGVEGLGVSLRGKRVKPSRYRPTHFDDPNKAYADLHQIKGRASAEAKETLHGWGFRPRNPRFYKVTERRRDPLTRGTSLFRVRKGPQYIKHKNLSAWIKSGRKTYKD